MNPLRWLVLLIVIAFVVLCFTSRRWARRYAQVVTLLLAGTIMMLPFAWLLCAAFKDKSVLNEYTFLPPPSHWNSSTINLDNFRVLLTPTQTVEGPVTFWRYLLNSLFLASASTFIPLVFSSLGGFALAKYRFFGKPLVVSFMLASLTIPGVVLLAPTFEVIWRLGWMDQFKALLVPGAVTVFGIFLFRQAIVRVPDDLIEAGRIDGCSEFGIYLRLVMPLVRPMTGAFCLISFLGAWNAFIGPNIFLQSQAKLPLPVVLNQYITVFQQQYGVFLAGTLLALIPPGILFLLLQKEFIRGLTSGAVKQ